MKVTKQMLLNEVGDFTYSFGMEFFIETKYGNFTWNDPDYGGDNTIKPFEGSYKKWCKVSNLPYSRHKVKHFIASYCGEDWELVE